MMGAIGGRIGHQRNDGDDAVGERKTRCGEAELLGVAESREECAERPLGSTAAVTRQVQAGSGSRGARIGFAPPEGGGLLDGSECTARHRRRLEQRQVDVEDNTVAISSSGLQPFEGLPRYAAASQIDIVAIAGCTPLPTEQRIRQSGERSAATEVEAAAQPHSGR